MKQSVLNLFCIILCIVILVLNPWPFEKSLNSSKTASIEKVMMVRAGFDSLHRDQSNPIRGKEDFLGQTAKPEQQRPQPEQSSFSNSNTDPKLAKLAQVQ